MSEGRSRVLPSYFVADQSVSMTNYIDQLNEGLNAVWEELNANPLLSSIAQFSVIGFGGEAHCYLEATDLTFVEQMPVLEVLEGGTSYSAALRTVRTQIMRDAQEFKASSHAMYRPSVFFLTDGEPTDDGDKWRSALADLTDSNFDLRPNILAFGIGESVSGPTILEIATKEDFAFKSKLGSKVGEAISNVSKVLIQSIVQSASAAAEGQNVEVAIPAPQGFKMGVELLTDG